MKAQYSHEFRLTAADCGPQREIALDSLTNLLIEVATKAANKLDVGFDCLIKTNLAWVLSRLAVEMHQPMVSGGSYRVETWVENLNRMFSERNFAIIDTVTEQEIGHARSTWMALDMDTRRPGDISRLTALVEAINDRDCPIEKCAKLLPVTQPTEILEYTFVTSDIDINRHVATRRYIDLLVDCWNLEFWNTHRLTRLDIAFKHEAHYGETAQVRRHDYNLEITAQGNSCALARLTFTDR